MKTNDGASSKRYGTAETEGRNEIMVNSKYEIRIERKEKERKKVVKT